MKLVIKSAFVFAMFAIVSLWHLPCMSATYNQATQPWVTAKLIELENKLTEKIQGISMSISTITNEADMAKAIDSAYASMVGTASARYAYYNSAVIPTSTNGMTSVFTVLMTSTAFNSRYSSNASVTNSFAYGRTMYRVSDDEYASKDGKVTISKSYGDDWMLNYDYDGTSFVLYSHDNAKFSDNNDDSVYVSLALGMSF